MAVINRIAGFADDMTAWRRHLHQHPELGFDCHETAGFVVEKLRSFGITEIETGIARSGVVAVIEGRGAGPVTGLRADMDALPMDEATGADWASTRPGAMHACGHDGHTTMLLGAARYLAETRNFSGRVVLIFQPAEENGGGGGVMVDEGIMDRYGIEEVYALHTLPGADEGQLLTTAGPIMAAVDTVEVELHGRGGHGAFPQDTVDPVVAAAGLVMALQTVVSRNVAARDEAVVSVTQIHTGSANNVVPETAWINATVRSFDPKVRDLLEERIREIVAGQAASYGVTAHVTYDRDYPATVNSDAQTAFAVDVARDVVGEARVSDAYPREMGAEDFSYMLESRPGSYLFLGQGPGPGLHHRGFDFNDRVAPVGASFFARLVERRHQGA